jgi:asparagine synthase (glutamine-hydrolysing)
MISGGIDSSYIAMVASKFMNKNFITTTTIDIDETLTNFEKNKIKELTDKIKMKNSILKVSSKSMIKDIFKNIIVYDDLQSSDPGFLTNYEIAKSLRKIDIKVVLVGDGSDEVLGGYSWFGLSKLPFSILPETIKNYLYIYSTSRIFSKKNSFKVFQKYFLEMKKFKNEDYFDSISQNEISNQLPNHYLIKVDKPFMRCGIEAKVPFLDNNFIEFAISIKSEFKLRGLFYWLSSFRKANEKFILREVFKRSLVSNISSVKKRDLVYPCIK